MLINRVVIKCGRDSKTALKTEIILLFHELRVLLIYVNKEIAKPLNPQSDFLFKSLQKKLATLFYQF